LRCHEEEERVEEATKIKTCAGQGYTLPLIEYVVVARVPLGGEGGEGLRRQ
jgi:hypothetical protein